LLWSGEFCAGPFSLEENGHKGNALLYTYMEFALVGDWILSVPSNRGKIVRILLTSRYAMWMAAGPELTLLYNDTCGKMTLGDKHPWAHGRPVRELWSEIWDEVGPRIERVLAEGRVDFGSPVLLRVGLLLHRLIPDPPF